MQSDNQTSHKVSSLDCMISDASKQFRCVIIPAGIICIFLWGSALSNLGENLLMPMKYSFRSNKFSVATNISLKKHQPNGRLNETHVTHIAIGNLNPKFSNLSKSIINIEERELTNWKSKYSCGFTICISIILTYWGRMTHICVSKLTIIGSDNGLSPGWHQAII